MTKEEIQETLRLHQLWLEDDPEGRQANLRGAILRGADMRGANLREANLREANLRKADMRKADLDWADLRGADLRGTDLREANLIWADLRGAILPDGVPIIQDIHRAVYEAASAPGALDMGQWHCGTTHCRAGWVVTLAGEDGKRLEDRLGTSPAAALIYYASDPSLERVPDWDASDEDALADMARLADAAE